MASLLSDVLQQDADQAQTARNRSASRMGVVRDQQYGLTSFDQSINRMTSVPMNKTLSLAAIVAQSIGMGDTSAVVKELGQRVADQSGFTESGDIEQGGFFEELPANLLLTRFGNKGGLALGGATGAIMKGLIPKSMTKSVLAATPKKTVASATGGVTKELGLEIAETLPSVALNLQQGKMEADGSVKTTNPTTTAEWIEMIALETAIGAVPSIAGGRAFDYAKGKYRTSKINQQFKDKKSAKLGLNAESLYGMNKTLLNDLGINDEILKKVTAEDGFIDFDKFKTEYDNANIDGEIAETEANLKRELTPDEESEIRSNYESKLVAFDDLKAAGLKGAFSDSEGNFYISSKPLGTLSGNFVSDLANRNQAAIVDLTKSSITSFSKEKTFEGNRILSPYGADLIAFQNAVAKAKQKATGESKHLSALEAVTFDDHGNIGIDDAIVSKIGKEVYEGVDEVEAFSKARASIIKELESDTLYRALKNSEVHSFGDGNVGSSQNMKTSKDMFASLLLAKYVSNTDGLMATLGKDSDRGVVYSYIKAFTSQLDLSTKIDADAQNMNVKVPDSDEERAILDMFFEKNDKPEYGEWQYTTMKPELKEALNVAFAIQSAKLIKDNGNIDMEGLSAKAIVTTAFGDKLLNVKGSGNVEAVKKMVTDNIQSIIENGSLGKDGEIDITEGTGRPEQSAEVKPEIMAIIAALGEDNDARLETINNAFQEGSRDWRNGISFGGKDTATFKDTWGLSDDPNVLASVSREINTKYTFDESYIATLNEIVAPKTGFNDLLEMLGLNEKVPPEGFKSMSPEKQDSMTEIVKGFVIEANDLLSMYKDHDPAAGIYFSAIIDPQKRIRYEALTNPKSSKLAMMALTPTNKLNNFFTEAGAPNIASITNYKRAFLTNFGYKFKTDPDAAGRKVEFLDDTEVEIAFDSMIKDFMDKDKKAAMIADEGIISYMSYPKLKEFLGILKNKSNKNLKLISEIDGKNNGTALLYASLGIDKESMGIGGRLAAGADIYEVFADILNKASGGKFGRSDVKTAVTGDVYLADPYTSSLAMSDVLIDTLMTMSTTERASVLNDVNGIAAGLVRANNWEKVYGSVNKKLKTIKSDVDRYNMLKAYFKTIGEKENPSVDDFRDSANLYNIKSLANERIFKELNDMKFDLKNPNNVRDLDLTMGMLALSNNIRLTDGQLNALRNRYAKSIHDSVSSSLKELHDPEVNALREHVKNITPKINFMQSLIFTSNDFIPNQKTGDKILTDLLLKSNDKMDASNPAVRLILDKYHAKYPEGKLSIEHALELLGQEGYLTDKVLGSKYLKDRLSMINAYGGMIPFTSYKGYAGYDPETRTNFGSITITDVVLPIYTIGHDATIMNKVLGEGQSNFLNKYDAIVSDPDSLPALAQIANEEVANMYDYANPVRDFLNTYDALDAQARLMGTDTRPAYTFMAQQILMKNGKGATADNVSMKVDELEQQKLYENSADSGSKQYNYRKKLEDLADKIDAKKASHSKDKKFEQYSNGNSDTVVTNTDTTPPSKGVHGEPKPLEYDIDTFDLQNVSKDVEGIWTFVKDGQVSNASASIDGIKGIKFDPNDTQIEAANGARITGDGIIIIKAYKDEAINDISFLETIFHEGGHVVYDGSHLTYKEAASFFEDFVNTGQIRDAEGNTLRLVGKTMTEDEAIVKLVGTMKHNEAILNNPNQVANRYGKTNLEAELKPLYVNGVKVLTLRDMERAIAGMPGTAEVITQMNKFGININGVVNTSPSVRSALANKEYAPFKTTMKGTLEKTLTYKGAIAKTNAAISDIPILELFAINPEKEAMEKIIALQKGGTNNLNMMTAEYVTGLLDVLRTVSDPTIDSKLGKFQLAGFSAVIDEFERSNTTNGSDSFFELVNQSVRELDQYFNSKAETNNKKDAVKRFNAKIKKLAFGENYRNTVNKHTIANDFLRDLHGDDRAKIDVDMPNAVKMVEKKAAQQRLNSSQHGKATVEDIIRIISTNKEAKNSIIELATISKRYMNKNDLFDANPEINPSASGNKIVMRTERAPGDKVIATYINDGVTSYAVEVNSDSFHMLDQGSQIVNPDLSAFESNIYNVGSGLGAMIVNPQNLELGTGSTIDTRFSQMAKRTFYAKQKVETAGDLFNRQYDMLKSEGIVLSAKEYEELIKDHPDMSKNYQILPTTNPISMNAGTHYYNAKWKHYIEGSEGIDIKSVSNAIFNDPKIAQFTVGLAKLFFGATNAFKNLVLQTRMSSYINSAISSSFIFMLHANQPSKMLSRMSESKQLLDQYKDTVKKLVKANNDGDVGLAKKLKTELEENKIHYAMEHGIMDTIRSDAYITGTYGENTAIQQLSKIFNKESAGRVKSFMLDPSDNYANKIGQVYDATELYPKIALYLDKLETANPNMDPKDLAAQSVLMSFPTYNNLNPLLNMIDSVSPYTKYMTNLPKMFLYTLDQHPGRLIPLHAAAIFAPPMTMNQDNEYERSLSEQGFLKIGGINRAWYYESAYPFYLPSKSFDSDLGALGSVLNFDFLSTAPWAVLDIDPTFAVK